MPAGPPGGGCAAGPEAAVGTPMPSTGLELLYHEPQKAALCGVHALNTLLQVGARRKTLFHFTRRRPPARSHQLSHPSTRLPSLCRAPTLVRWSWRTLPRSWIHWSVSCWQRRGWTPSTFYST